jgi:hypothetical protein
MSSLDLFYRNSRRKIRDRFVADYVSSEYGVALLLDQHVNRPGHVPGTLAEAVDALANEVRVDNPQEWTDEEEHKLLSRYLTLRHETSMTDSAKRANRTKQAVASGLASDQRGSFQV